jgi:hypothetical protein
MSLDSTARKANFVYSIKKHIIDNLYTGEGILPIFDQLLPPDKSVSQWLFVRVGPLSRNTVSDFSVEIYCVTRNDYEGVRLFQLIDLVTGYFCGDTAKPDGLIRIPFYDAVTQTQNDSMLVMNCEEGETLDAPDESKFVVLTINLKMASKI